METMQVESHKIEWIRRITQFLGALKESNYVEIKILDDKAWYVLGVTNLSLTDEQVKSIRKSVYENLLKEVMGMLPEPEKSHDKCAGEVDPDDSYTARHMQAIHDRSTGDQGCM